MYINLIYILYYLNMYIYNIYHVLSNRYRMVCSAPWEAPDHQSSKVQRPVRGPDGIWCTTEAFEGLEGSRKSKQVHRDYIGII